MEHIANELRSYFSERGITQQSIANELHVSKAYINALFTGRTSIGKSTARKLSELYGISESWLLTGEGAIAKYDGNGIPEYDVDFSCGNAVMYTDSTAIVGTLSMSEYANATAIVRATGVAKETISRALGHSTSTVTDIYINYNNRIVDEANRKVIDFINNL